MAEHFLVHKSSGKKSFPWEYRRIYQGPVDADETGTSTVLFGLVVPPSKAYALFPTIILPPNINKVLQHSLSLGQRAASFEPRIPNGPERQDHFFGLRYKLVHHEQPVRAVIAS